MSDTASTLNAHAHRPGAGGPHNTAGGMSDTASTLNAHAHRPGTVARTTQEVA